MTERIHARYWIETAFPLDSAAATMAGEQSTGTFLRVPGETDELRERYAARVESITELGTVKTPSLPGSGVPKGAARHTATHRRGHSLLAAREHGPIAPQPTRNRRRQSL